MLLPGDPGRRCGSRSADRRAADAQPPSRPLGLHGLAGDGAPDDPEHGPRRPERGGRGRGAVALGARRLVRVGTAPALGDGASSGRSSVVDAALADDGTSRALGAGERVAADEALTAALAGARPRRARSRRPTSTTRAAARAGRAGRGGRDLATAARADRRTPARHPAAVVLAVTRARGERLGRRAVRRSPSAGCGPAALGSAPWPRRPRRPYAGGPRAAGRHLEPLLLARRRRGPRRAPRIAPSSAASLASWPRSPPGASRAGRLERREPLVETVDAVLDALEPLRHRAQRRVRRSMSAAEGRLSAPMAASCAWTARSRPRRRAMRGSRAGSRAGPGPACRARPRPAGDALAQPLGCRRQSSSAMGSPGPEVR